MLHLFVHALHLHFRTRFLAWSSIPTTSPRPKASRWRPSWSENQPSVGSGECVHKHPYLRVEGLSPAIVLCISSVGPFRWQCPWALTMCWLYSPGRCTRACHGPDVERGWSAIHVQLIRVDQFMSWGELRSVNWAFDIDIGWWKYIIISLYTEAHVTTNTWKRHT